MAKVCFLFIAAFCIVQIALAFRLPRETGFETSTENGIMDSLHKLQEGFSNTFTQENLQKFSETVSQNAGAINEKLKDTFTQENLKKLSDKVVEQASELNTQLKKIGSDVQTKFEEITSQKEEKSS